MPSCWKDMTSLLPLTSLLTSPQAAAACAGAPTGAALLPACHCALVVCCGCRLFAGVGPAGSLFTTCRSQPTSQTSVPSALCQTYCMPVIEELVHEMFRQHWKVLRSLFAWYQTQAVPCIGTGCDATTGLAVEKSRKSLPLCLSQACLCTSAFVGFRSLRAWQLQLVP